LKGLIYVGTGFVISRRQSSFIRLTFSASSSREKGRQLTSILYIRSPTLSAGPVITLPFSILTTASKTW
jgi:hypothetical protein